MMSSTISNVEGLAAAPRAGADLRAARERLGWAIEDVSAALRIRLPHLEALEEGRIDQLPGNAYAVGFLRTYARALGLDPDEIARRFKAEASDVNRRTELVFPAPVPQRGMPAGAMILLGVVLAIGAYAGWYRLSGEGRLPAEVVAPLPERLASLADQVVPPAPPVVKPAPVAVAAATPDPAAAEPAAPPAPSISPTSAAAAPVPPIAMTAPPPAAAPAPPPADTTRIVVQTTADAWLQVRDRNSGGILLNRVLHSGDSWPVPSRPNLVLTTGNAGGTELIVDGVVTQVAGGPGAVRRDLPLDPELIKDGRLAQNGAVQSLSPQGGNGQGGSGQGGSGQGGSGQPSAGGPAFRTPSQ